ncbi:hypothetical protein SUGI_0646040 [Cryptomeria japonica]|uniref:uncharacterized protein LOC131067295 n=1 Tax=Cryptomeria japonica TaxID=3369 RepID=UPI0024147014|nr:uncharacterized protein LOC131067295 [Cryptomeria japonica]GLJ32085.1 hypothetical protein SUGI_0646040 [Cryptomeria japonica]
MEASKDHPTPYPGRVKQRFAPKPSPRGQERTTSNEITVIPKREKRLLSVSKSVSTLDLSGKDKPARATRRLSIPSKYATPVSKADNKLSSSTPSGNTTEKKSTSKPDFILRPVNSENKARATAKSVSVSFQGSISRNQGKANGVNKDALATPTNGVTVQEYPKSGQRKKFSTLMSSSYWLAQVKLAESAGKHAISLGFFRLALESTAEPLQRLGDELKSYAKKHNLLDLGEVARDVLQNYGILEEVIAEVETKVRPKDVVAHIPEACPLIPENVEEEEEDSSSGSDSQNSKKNSTDACSPKVNVCKARKARKSDSNKNPSTEKIDSPHAEKPDDLTSPIGRASMTQKRKKSSIQLVTRTTTTIVGKASNVIPADKASLAGKNQHAARRSSLNPAMKKNPQNEIKAASQKDKGSNMNKPSQLDPPSVMESTVEQDKENQDFQQMDTTNPQNESEVLVQG